MLTFKIETIKDLCTHPDTSRIAYYTSNSDKQGIRSVGFISCALFKVGEEMHYEIRWGESPENDISDRCQDQKIARLIYERHLSRLQELEQETSLSASAAVR